MSARRSRISTPGLLAALAVQALFAWVLISGLSIRLPDVVRRQQTAITVLPEPPPPPPEPPPPPRPDRKAAEGRAAPPNLRAKASPVVAPPPVFPIVVPPPITAAPVPGEGAAPSAGAADVAGPGAGAGGEGDGPGAGGDGDGPGAGGTPSERIGGRIRDRDYPDAALDEGSQGYLVTRYVVDVDGRVRDCSVLESSGSPVLDETTCRLIRQRYRFRPARNAAGEPVPDVIIHHHEWVIGERG